jgi:hypothetical protein
LFGFYHSSLLYHIHSLLVKPKFFIKSIKKSFLGVFISVKSELRNVSIEIIDSRICAIRPEYWEPMLYYMAVTTFLVFVIPIIVITVLYVLMGITLYKASHRTLNHNDEKKHEQIVLHHRGQQRVLLRQNTSSINNSKPTKNSRRAVLKMLGKKKTIKFDFFRNEILIFSGGGNCVFYLLGTISYTTYNSICYTIIR